MIIGLDERMVELERAKVACSHGGSGPPLLLLHGFPQTRLAWARIVDRLKARYSLVVPDSPGYGASQLRRPAIEIEGGMSKRALARDMIELMAFFGHERFSIAGHDRGARIAYRLALDHPGKVARLAILDVAPTLEVWAAMDDRAAREAWHWPLLAAPAPVPERMIFGAHDVVIPHLLDKWTGVGALDPRARGAYIAQFSHSSVCEAAAEDYRAGATVDLEHDRADLAAGAKITAPLYALHGRRYGALAGVDVEALWRRWAVDVRAEEFDCGHFLAEELPEIVGERLARFFSDEVAEVPSSPRP